MISSTDDERLVVAHFNDGRVIRGTTRDFDASPASVSIRPDGDHDAEPLEIPLGALKAVFFVRTWDGDPERVDSNRFERVAGRGRRVLVTFADGEIVAGFAAEYAANKPGFFLVPADPKSNNERVFVVKSAVTRVEFVMAWNPAFADAASSA